MLYGLWQWPNLRNNSRSTGSAAFFSLVQYIILLCLCSGIWWALAIHHFYHSLIYGVIHVISSLGFACWSCRTEVYNRICVLVGSLGPGSYSIFECISIGFCSSKLFLGLRINWVDICFIIDLDAVKEKDSSSSCSCGFFNLYLHGRGKITVWRGGFTSQWCDESRANVFFIRLFRLLLRSFSLRLVAGGKTAELGLLLFHSNGDWSGVWSTSMVFLRPTLLFCRFCEARRWILRPLAWGLLKIFMPGVWILGCLFGSLLSSLSRPFFMKRLLKGNGEPISWAGWTMGK